MKVLFVCLGNTCRSPMAKVIFEQILKKRGLQDGIFTDSAAKESPSLSYAKSEARKAIKQLYGADLLAEHKPKSIRSMGDLASFDLILTMNEEQKLNLPPEKTYTLKEYGGLEGEVFDPWGEDLDTYIKCRDEIKDCLERIIDRKQKEWELMFTRSKK